MASSGSWRDSLSSSQRYTVIQKIQDFLPNGTVNAAIEIEEHAYQTSSSLDEYQTSWMPKDLPAEPSRMPPPQLDPLASQPSIYTPSDAAVCIGAYDDCHHLAYGVTSDVYRSGPHALKVITSGRPFAPHDPLREIRILRTLQPPCIPLIESFRDHEQRLVLVFPYMPYTLDGLLDSGPLPADRARTIFADVLSALGQIHAQGIVHRDVKPSAVLLASPSGPAYLADFGTAWHPEFSAEARDDKVLDIGTGPYRAPEVLFADKEYGPPVDMWGFGVMLSEALRDPPLPVFESRPASEDGSQLGLILSIFKTLGTPTPETWPEAREFKVEPFELWTVFPQKQWPEILPSVDDEWRELVAALLRYDGTRATAEQALEFGCFKSRGTK